MVTDDDIADLFAKAVQDLDPAIGPMVGKAELMGRRLRSRRRAWIAAGGSLAVAAMVGAGVAGVSLAAPSLAPGVYRATGNHPAAGPGGGPASGHGHQAAAGKPNGGQNPPAQPTPTPTPMQGGMTRQQLLAALRHLLPAGGTLTRPRGGLGAGGIEADYNDGKGAVDLILSVSPSTTYSGQVLRCPHPLWTDEGNRPAGALPISCVTRTLPGGSIERDAVMYADAYGFYGYDIYDQRPDGVTVFIQVGNGTNDTLPQVDRARPPGSMAQWRAIAENPGWHL